MSMVANDSRGGAIFDSRGMVGRIYKEDHSTLLHTKYTHGNKLGNTFSSREMFEKIHFPIFWRY